MIKFFNLKQSSSSNDSAVMMAKMELKKLNEKERWMLEKERMKARETPEEKRARRLMKRQIKQVSRQCCGCRLGGSRQC